MVKWSSIVERLPKTAFFETDKYFVKIYVNDHRDIPALIELLDRFDMSFREVKNEDIYNVVIWKKYFDEFATNSRKGA